MNSVDILAEPLVEVDGTSLAAEDGRTLTEIRVQQRLSHPTMCELTFVDPGEALAEGHVLRPGSSLRVALTGHAEYLFEGEVTAMEFAYLPSRGREVRVRGFDALHRLRKRWQVRSHVQVSPKDLARELVADLGLSVSAAEPGPLRQILIQQNQSDLDLLLDETEFCGLYLALRGKTLHLCTLDGIGDPAPLELGDSLLEAHFEVNADPACRSVAVACWNPSRAEHHKGRASTARTGRQVAAEAPPSRFGAIGEILVSDEVGPDSRYAQAIAQAELDRRAASEVILWGTAQGDPRLRPASRVSVSGVTGQFSGRYVLTGVTHLIDRRLGYVSEITTSLAPPRPRGRSTLATKGIVTRVNDPDKLGRLRVSLPTYGDVETDWMEMLSIGAGSGKGLVISPEVGDQVLVLLMHQDPAHGVVLGGLYGIEGPPDPGLEDGAVRRYTLLTGKGQKMLLDDSGKVIRFENSEGSYVELSPKKVRIHAATDLDLEAPGHSIVISGRSIDFQKA